MLTEDWPKILAAEGCIDPAERRNRALAAQAEAWRAHPPADPVIAAGSTGSIPATAALLDVIAGLPNGRVVLPGLDRDARRRDLDGRCSRMSPIRSMACARLLRRLAAVAVRCAAMARSLRAAAPPARAACSMRRCGPAATTAGRQWRER